MKKLSTWCWILAALLAGGLTVSSLTGVADAGVQTQSRPVIWRASGSSSSSSSGGGIVDGGLTNISGTGFGSNVSQSNQEFLGGVNGVIESNSNGTTWSSVARSGWTFPGSANQTISTNTSLNGTKSLANLGFNDSSNFQYGSKFDMGAARRVVFVRFSIKFVVASGSRGQIKIFRMVGGPLASSEGINDANTPNWYVGRTYGGIGSYLATNDGSGSNPVGTLDPSSGTGTGGEWLETATSAAGTSDWYTFEWVFTAPSADAAADGAVSWRIINENTGATKTSGTVSSLAWWQNSVGTPIQYVVFQGYMCTDSCMGAGSNWANTTTQPYWDRDVYITWADSGTTAPKYILLCNAATFAASTVCTVNQWEGSWSNTSITNVRVNQGRHSNLTGKYWYIMSAPGVAINSSGIAASIFDIQRPANDDYFMQEEVRWAA